MKKYTTEKFAIILFISLCFMTCTKELNYSYKGGSSVYFNNFKGVNNSKSMIDTLAISFTYVERNKRDSVYPLVIKTLGGISKEDRIVKLVVDPSSTAIKGKHYSLPKDNNILIHAQKVSDTIPITFYRIDDLKNKKYTLTFILESNDSFTTGNDYLDNRGNEGKNRYKFKFIVSELPGPPPQWGGAGVDGLTPYFGDYSAKKYNILRDVLGVPLDFFTKGSNPSYFHTKFKRYIEKNKIEGTPILEEDGTEMSYVKKVQ